MAETMKEIHADVNNWRWRMAAVQDTSSHRTAPRPPDDTADEHARQRQYSACAIHDAGAAAGDGGFPHQF